MKVTEAKFGRKYKVADYESEEYVLTAIIEGEERPLDVLKRLKEDVAAAFGGEGDSSAVEKPGKKPSKKKVEEEDEDEATDNDENENEDSTDEDASEESDQDGNEDDEATEDSSESDDDDDSDPSDEEDEEPKKKAKGKSEKPASEKKKFKKKPQNYSRQSEAHKEIFSSVLKSVMPDWKKSEDTKKRAKLVSQKLEGKEFLDESGEVLVSFKIEAKRMMAAKKLK